MSGQKNLSGPLAPPQDVIRHLTSAQLNDVVRKLFLAEASLYGADTSKVQVNTDDTAADDGCDGWTPAPARKSKWLGDTDTCWQIKAGKQGEPSRIAGEIGKPIPKKTLAAGKRFALIASGSVNGKKGEEDRAEQLCKDAAALQLPTDKITVLTSEALATWIGEIPAVAADIAGFPASLWSIDKWALDPKHNIDWSPSDEQKQELEDVRTNLDPTSGTVRHIHIHGRPGVGKTRFALEVCREASWKETALYIRQAADVNVGEILDRAVETPHTRLTLVVDEVSSTQLQSLNMAVQHGDGRVRLITIGHEPSTDSSSIPSIEVKPLDDKRMEAIIRAWFSAMPVEQIRFVIQFSSGFVRLAKIAATAVVKQSNVDVPTLFAHNDIRSILDKLLDNSNRQPLHVVAVLDSIGWQGTLEVEGQTVAEHLGLNWLQVKAAVQVFDDKYGIAPRGGNLRYISPTVLGVYLANEAWKTYPDQLNTLLPKLLWPRAREAFLKRYSAVVSGPGAKQFAEEEIGRFFSLSHFLDSDNVQRWAAASAANPKRALSNVRKALEVATPNQRMEIKGNARRDLVWALERLAWPSAGFTDATLSLAYLAEAENETWANNASGEFTDKFQISLGGTALPYPERMRVIDELVNSKSPRLVGLAVKALTKSASSHQTRMVSSAPPIAPMEEEWRPVEVSEYQNCVRLALSKLAAIAETSAALARSELIAAADAFSLSLRSNALRDEVAKFMRSLIQFSPDTREPVRQAVYRTLAGERKYWKELGADDLAWLESFHNELEDPSPEGQLRQQLGASRWEDDDRDLASIAQLVASDPAILDREWVWITSGEAAGSWDFGVELAKHDPEGTLLERMCGLQDHGPDLRVVAGYIKEWAKSQPEGWVDDWIDQYESRHPNDLKLITEVTWRCASTSRGAARIERLVREGLHDEHAVGQLVYGGWSQGPDIKAFASLIQTLSQIPKLKEVAIALLEHRVDDSPQDWQSLQTTAIALVVDSEIVQSSTMTSYYWAKVAKRLMPEHSREIARAIISLQAHPGSSNWFARYSEAGKVLTECATLDPTGTWNELVPFLEDKKRSAWLAIGFPTGVVDILPKTEVLEWAATDPENRAPILAHLVGKSLADDTLAASLLDRFRGVEDVQSAFFSAFTSGTWWGPTSEHWTGLALELDKIASTSTLRGVRDWATATASELRAMAEREREREAEERLRW